MYQRVIGNSVLHVFVWHSQTRLGDILAFFSVAVVKTMIQSNLSEEGFISLQFQVKVQVKTGPEAARHITFMMPTCCLDLASFLSLR